MKNGEGNQRHNKRDAESLMLLGGFMAALAVPVLAGTIFADTDRAMVVNLIAGILLFAVGAAFFLRGRVVGKNRS